jgi:anti-anti-sigma factor
LNNCKNQKFETRNQKFKPEVYYMALEIKERKEGEIDIVELFGELDSSSVSAFNLRFKEVTDKLGLGKYVVDMSSLIFISSAGWSAFVNECKRLRKSGGDFKLAAMQKDAERVYDLVGIASVIKSYKTVKEAVESYGAGR